MLSAAVTTPFTFQEWLELNPDMKAKNLTDEEEIECEDCEGTGGERCPYCDEIIDPCTECDGAGTIAKEKNAAKEFYESELAQEKARLERFLAFGTLPPIPGGA